MLGQISPGDCQPSPWKLGISSVCSGAFQAHPKQVFIKDTKPTLDLAAEGEETVDFEAPNYQRCTRNDKHRAQIAPTSPAPLLPDSPWGFFQAGKSEFHQLEPPSQRSPPGRARVTISGMPWSSGSPVQHPLLPLLAAHSQLLKIKTILK